MQGRGVALTQLGEPGKVSGDFELDLVGWFGRRKWLCGQTGSDILGGTAQDPDLGADLGS